MVDSAKRIEMPPVPEAMFMEAVDEVVRANKDWIPPFESGGALYLRPYLFATSFKSSGSSQPMNISSVCLAPL